MNMIEQAEQYYTESKARWEKRWHFWKKVEWKARKLGLKKLESESMAYQLACCTEICRLEEHLRFLNEI